MYRETQLYLKLWELEDLLKISQKHTPSSVKLKIQIAQVKKEIEQCQNKIASLV